MKYNILDQYKLFLTREGLAKNTVKTYYNAVNRMLEPFQFNSLAEISAEEIQAQLKKLKTKNEVSIAKSGLSLLNNFDSQFNLPSEDFFNELSNRKRNLHPNNGKYIYKDRILRTINQMQNKKLKLAYRLALVSGLRISEVADLEKRNIEFGEENKLIVKVVNGKGGKSRTVETLADKYVFKELQKYIADKKENEKLFYDAGYMINKACSLDFECHDLRRIYAQTKYIQVKQSGKTAYKARKETQVSLGHSKPETTELYLHNRKLVSKKIKVPRGEELCYKEES